MKIAFLTDGIFPTIIGGMQKHSYYLVKYFAQKQVFIDLYYFVPKEKDDLLKFSDDELKYITPIKLNYPEIPNIPGQYVIQEYFYSKKIFTELNKREKVDFIYSQGFTSWAFPKKVNIPIGLNLHGFEMFQITKSKKENLKKRLLQLPAKQSYKKADYIFSFGAKFNKLLSGLNIPERKQKIFYNGISNDWINTNITKTSNVRTFLFVGRYEIRKGIDILNKVIESLIADKLNFKFIFVGPIPKEKQIINSRIDYKGSISSEIEIKKIYEEADVYVLPSLSEGMPTVILEAMASGLAIIGTNVGAVSHTVSPDNGILINPNNQLELEQSIKKMIFLSDENINVMKTNSLNKVKENFTWDIIANNYIQFFNEITSK